MELSGEFQQALRPLGSRTEGPQPTSGYCQRCKAGVYVPENELRRCPGCARDVCSQCRTYEPEIEAYVCLECARVRRAKRRATRQAQLHWLRALACLGMMGIGILVMVTSFLALGAAITALGMVGFAWHLVGYPVCPLCEGRGVSHREKGRPRRYRCTLCRHQWES